MNVGLPDDIARIHRLLVAHAYELMTVVDENGAIVFENQAVARVAGYQMDERIGRSVFEFVHPEDSGRMREAFTNALASRETTPLLDLRARHRDGRWLPIESVARFVDGDAGVVYGLVHSRDVSERHTLQTRLRHAEKLTALGRLTTSLADDLAAIVGTIRTRLCTMGDPGTSGPVPLGLRGIMKATETAGALARQLRAFGVMVPVFPHQVDLHELLREIRHELSDQIPLHMSLEAGRRNIRTDRAALRQGLKDLLLGFRYAMPENSLVTIATTNLLVPPSPYAPTDPSIDYIVVTITNDGREGFEQLSGRFFEPSALAPVSGTILLALVTLHDIVSYAGGFIEFASTASGTTRILVYLPLS